MRGVAVMMGLALVSAVEAGSVVKITSNDPARVAVDGEDLGLTPITLRDIKPGNYEIKLENVRTGLVQTYAVKSPRNATIEREISAKWAVEAATPVAPAVEAQAQAPFQAQAPAPAAEVTPVQPVAAVTPVAPPATSIETQVGGIAADAPPAPAAAVAAAEDAAAKERLKVKARNTLIGAAVANEVFNKGSSKKTVRKAAVGLGLLNEALNR